MTLNNLAILYSGTQRMADADSTVDEALRIRRDLYSKNTAVFANDLARSLLFKALLKRQGDAPAGCGLAREGGRVAMSDQLKALARNLAAGYCAQ